MNVAAFQSSTTVIVKNSENFINNLAPLSLNIGKIRMGSYNIIVFKLVVVLAVFSTGYCDMKPPIPMADMLNPAVQIGECQACKLFIESFNKGLERTERGKYEGGDAAWEEEKLKTAYRRSELRLVDIQEAVCKELNKHAVQCHNMAEKAEEYVEEWWANGGIEQEESIDLYKYICIENLKVCCPAHHYGRDCRPCLGDLNNLCSGHGKCRGDGTRKGNGTCLCNVGYSGTNCEICMTGYYLKSEDENKISCVPCHPSCMGGCTGATNKDCVACKPGFEHTPENGCTDINECETKDICKRSEFCLNSMGAYICKNCDKSCDGCDGDGPDMCRKCAAGYSKRGDFCAPDREEEDLHTTHLRNARYITYIGLLIATGILLPSSTSLGSIVGALVLSYIVGAEYYCMINNNDGLLTNMWDFDLFQIFK